LTSRGWATVRPGRPTTVPSLVRSFERHLRAENRSEHTIASYLESLRHAEAFLAGRGGPSRRIGCAVPGGALVARERAGGPTVTAAEVMAVTGRSRRRAYSCSATSAQKGGDGMSRPRARASARSAAALLVEYPARDPRRSRVVLVVRVRGRPRCLATRGWPV